MTAVENCPNPNVHGNPFRYCPHCDWREEPEPPTTITIPLDGLEETIARVLGEHGWTWKAFTQRPTEAECTAPGCDWTWRVPLSGDIDPVAIHEAEKAHRADAIARAVAGDGAR